MSAPPVPGTLVCNIGDCLKFWTNGAYGQSFKTAAWLRGIWANSRTPGACTLAGEYQSTPHRVINLDRTKSRVSVPFFYEPDFEATVQPIEELHGGRLAQECSVLNGSSDDALKPQGQDRQISHCAAD